MKILLQHARTHLYLGDNGRWRVDAEEAYDFQHSKVLIDFVQSHRLSGVQIAVKFIEAEYDEIVPIPPHQFQPSPRFNQ